MAALAQDRNTPARAASTRQLKVAANAKIYAGALVVLAAGVAKPGSTALNLVAVGRAEHAVDNTGGADGAQVVDVRPGTFRYANSAGADEVTDAQIGSDCFVVDDQTVAKTDGGGTRSKAGEVFAVDAQGVWVKFK